MRHSDHRRIAHTVHRVPLLLQHLDLLILSQLYALLSLLRRTGGSRCLRVRRELMLLLMHKLRVRRLHRALHCVLIIWLRVHQLRCLLHGSWRSRGRLWCPGALLLSGDLRQHRLRLCLIGTTGAGNVLDVGDLWYRLLRSWSDLLWCLSAGQLLGRILAQRSYLSPCN